MYTSAHICNTKREHHVSQWTLFIMSAVIIMRTTSAVVITRVAIIRVSIIMPTTYTMCMFGYVVMFDMLQCCLIFGDFDMLVF
jgi:hypothetical protein